LGVITLCSVWFLRPFFMKKIKDSNEEYHSHNSISASGLKIIYKQSVYHYLNQEPYTSKAMNFGTAVHSVLLDDEVDLIKTLPQLDLRYKKDKQIKQDFIKKNKNKIIISHKENIALKNVIDNYRKHNTAMDIIDNLDEKEYSYYGTIDGVPVRVRPDGIKFNKHIIDIKTCQDASPKAFRNAIYNFSYHLQACFYSEALGYDPANFRFIAVENKFPYQIEIYSMGETMIEYGKKAWRDALQKWKNYLDTGKVGGFIWDNYNDDKSLIL